TRCSASWWTTWRRPSGGPRRPEARWSFHRRPQRTAWSSPTWWTRTATGSASLPRPRRADPRPGQPSSRSADGRLDRERAGGDVDRRRYAHGYRELAGTVADRESAEHGYAEVAQPVGQNVHNGHPPVVGTSGELSDRDAGEPTQQSGPAQVGQHAVHLVRRFADLFEQQHGTGQVGEVRGADRRREQAQVAAQQGTGGGARHGHAGRLLGRGALEDDR